MAVPEVATSMLQQHNSQNTMWDNTDNQNFYNTVGVEGLQHLAGIAGIENNCDLKQLKPYWINANNILEVGAGYGRVINALRENGYCGEITAIERNTHFCDYLKEQYKEHTTILAMDIMACDDLEQRFDCILFLWGGFVEFSAYQQLIVIKKLSTLLTTNGLIIIDSLPEDVAPLATTKIGERDFCLTVDNMSINVHITSQDEMSHCKNSAKLNYLSTLQYCTTSNRTREFYLLSNNKISD